MAVDRTFMVAGEAGQGVQTLGYTLARAFTRGGYHVLANQDYESRIRGGHSAYQVRIRDEPVHSVDDQIHVLISLDRASIDIRRAQMSADGLVLFDSERVKLEESGPQFIGVPFERMAAEQAGDRLMSNTVACGVALGLVQYDFSTLEHALRRSFMGKGTDVVERNITAARAGYDHALSELKGACSFQLPASVGPPRLLMNGNDAVVLGALSAGVKFMSSYPMTPSTEIMEQLATRAREFGLVVLQAEDEIGAMNMTVGAGFAGVRAMVATSGGGFSLMVEGLGLAGMTETPLVAVEGQRPGPATGLPTRTEQGDLEFVLHCAQGEFPRIMLSPGNIEQDFYLTVHAFNLAERYQTPVIIMHDEYMADSVRDFEPFDFGCVTVDRGLMWSAGQSDGPYQRHMLTDSGISPRAYAGTPGITVCTTGDEHTEEGHITEDMRVRTEMVRKRLRKLEEAAKHVVPPETYGPEDAPVLLIGWGSLHGAMREAVDLLAKEGLRARMMQLPQVWPFPREQVAAAVDAAKHVIVVEQNATGQLAHLMRAETGRAATGRVNRFDGRPMSAKYVGQRVKQEVGERW